ncbi:MAG: malto-oligosyltrehalose trehalohydrolase [Gemmatimonadetes bacterium]|nr:malto-oligosyltrehalose trehalohydrolase [Gemmatimonadota bacterium]
MAVVVGGEDRPLARGEDGWWRPDAPLRPGTDYAFRVDGEGPFPDPRSPWQPQGVHRPSRAVDHGAFDWSDAAWRGFHLPSAVLYELHVGTFSPEGTFEGAARRLDHLVDLGVDAVELLPVNAFPGRHGWGYDGVALWAVHEPYGGPEGLKRFVDACHARGLGVVLDVVYNHLGPSGNYLGRFGPYFTETYHTPWGSAVNFDGAGSHEVRAFVVENALAWLRDYHLDGLRLDAVHAILDTSAVHVLEEMAERVEALAGALGRPLWLMPESDLNDPRLVRGRDAGGYGLDAQWSDDLHHAVHAALTGERTGYYADFGALGDVATALRDAYVYARRFSSYRGHVHGRPAGDLPGHRFLGYLQNHDQVGNRARGERIGHLVSPGRQKVGAALVLTSPFVPMLFQGEEWAASAPFQYFTDHEEEELAEAVRGGRRREFAAFGWSPEEIPDPQDPATFERSKLDWEERGEPAHRDMLAWYRSLLALRRRIPELGDGRRDRVESAVDERAGTLVVRRGPVTVACNLGDAPVDVAASGELTLASDEGVRRDGDALRLPPDTVGVLVGP